MRAICLELNNNKLCFYQTSASTVIGGTTSKAILGSVVYGGSVFQIVKIENSRYRASVFSAPMYGQQITEVEFATPEETVEWVVLEIIISDSKKYLK